MEPSPPSRTVPVPAWPDAAPPAEAEWPLIGRDDELRRLTDDLADGTCRAIVLTGLGGVGKTRLAAEVARGVAHRLAGRVAWIPLAHAPRDGGLALAIAAGLGLADLEPDHVAEAVAETIGDEPALLVLDSVEAALHDLGLIDELLDLAPPLRLLVTSRIAIERAGLATVAIGPLAVPATTDDAATIAASPSVALLADRATRAGAEVAITDRTAPAIARLVTRLDGLPLAVELAAPLLRVLPPHRLLDRIDSRLDALRATLDWSHDHLDPDAQRLYRRLAVFGGAFSLADVRAFVDRCVGHGLAPLERPFEESLGRLVAASLVRVARRPPGGDEVSEPADGGSAAEEPRYELPSLVRDDAARRLEAGGEATAALWARANCLLELAEETDAGLAVRSRLSLLHRLDEVHDDLLAALDRARAAGEGAFMLRLAGALAEYWRSRGRLAEGRIWLDTAIRLGPTDPTPERARALHGAGMLANWQSDFRRARTVLEEALAIRLATGRPAEAAATLNQLGLIGLDLGDLDEAERHCRQGLDIRRTLGDEAAVASSLNTLGGVVQWNGRNDEAAALYEESLAIRRRIGDDAGSSVSLGNLGLVARDRGDLDAAEAMLREAIGTRERLGDRQRVSVVRHNLALVLFDRGDLAAARAELEASIATARDLGDRLETANALSDLGFVEAAAGRRDRAATLQLEALVVAGRLGAKGIVAQAIDGIAGLVAADGRPAEAATLWAAAEAVRREAHYHLLQADRRRVDREIETTREQVAEEAWWRAWAEGEQLPIDDAIARARAALGSPVPSPRAAGQVAV